MRIVFLGTPDFAAASLQSLLTHHYNVVAVVTAPDKPAGRGMQLQQSAVKKVALAHQIPVLQPEKLKSPDFIDTLKSYNADIQVVVAFRMLPEIVWRMPPLGTINVHASLLPNYRGAAPINWAIMNGEHKTGVTTFSLQHQIDTGNVLLQKEVLIENSDNAGRLHDKLMKAGALLLVETLHQIENHQITSIPQAQLLQQDTLHHAPKIFTETCLINWHQNTDKIHNHIRGLSPYPAAFTHIGDKKFKILEAYPVFEGILHPPGTIITDNKNFVHISTLDGSINISQIQMEGKKAMQVADFLRGNKLTTLKAS